MTINGGVGDATPKLSATTYRHPQEDQAVTTPVVTMKGGTCDVKPALYDVCYVAAKLARRTTVPEWKAPQALAQRDARASILVCRARHGRFRGLHFGSGCCEARQAARVPT